MPIAPKGKPFAIFFGESCKKIQGQGIKIKIILNGQKGKRSNSQISGLKLF